MLLSTSENARWRRWAWWTLVLLVVSYIWYGSREYPHGGSSIGLLYGTVGLVIILVLVYFGVRKRSYMSLMSRILIYFGVLRHPDKDVYQADRPVQETCLCPELPDGRCAAAYARGIQ